MEENIKIPWLPECESYLMKLYRQGLEYEPHVKQLIGRYKGLCYELGANYGLNCFDLPDYMDYFGFEPDDQKFSFLKLNSKHRCCKDIDCLPFIKDKPLTLLISNKTSYLYQLRSDLTDYVLEHRVPVLLTMTRSEMKEWEESQFWKQLKAKDYYATRISGDCYLFKTICHRC